MLPWHLPFVEPKVASCCHLEKAVEGKDVVKVKKCWSASLACVHI